jgi:hypothetical protein
VRCNFTRLLVASGKASDGLASGEIALAAHEKALGHTIPGAKTVPASPPTRSAAPERLT